MGLEKIRIRAALALVLLASGPLAGGDAPARKISRQLLEDKVRGGWAGQMIGVSYGAPTEFRALGKTYDAKIAWTPERVSNAIGQDDLYVEMTFAEVMDRVGLDATTKDYAEMFKASKYRLWHANAAARRHLLNGVEAPLSGDPRYNIHANDIDFQIEADFIGLMAPGLPAEAIKICERVGRVMNHGDGLYGGMFTSGMYAAAFFEDPAGDGPRRVVEAGLACLPSESGYARVVRDVLQWSVSEPDWKKTWKRLVEAWDKDDPCTDGALQPFNIDARLNGAFIAVGLLYGKGDFAATLEVSTRCGQDSDCNPSSAGGILGTMLGYSRIPDEWKSGIPALAGAKFQFTSYSFEDICKSTLRRAQLLIERAGGSTSVDPMTIPLQAPVPPPLEQWDMGVPDRLVEVDDRAFRWNGGWSKEGRRGAMTAHGRGAEVILEFEGSALALVGPCTPDGGKADLVLDGDKVGVANAWTPAGTNDNDLWHAFGLGPGKHTLKVTMRDDADPRSQGKKLAIERAITYRPRGPEGTK